MVLDDLEVGWVHRACGTQVWITGGPVGLWSPNDSTLEYERDLRR